MTARATIDLDNIPRVLTAATFLAESRPFFEPPPYQSKFDARPWKDLFRPGLEHEWLVKKMIAMREVSILAGASGGGKTFLAIDLAGKIIQGRPFFGARVARGGVIYQVAEDEPGVLLRMRALMVENGLSLEQDQPFVLLPKCVNFHASEDGVNALIAELKHWSSVFERDFSVPLVACFVDTFSKATSGANENDGKDMGPILDRLHRVAKECRTAVIPIHHMNAQANKVRGWTGIHANVDSVLIVEKSDPPEIDIDGELIRHLIGGKAKNARDGRSWKFVLPEVELGRDAAGDLITSCVVRAPNTDGDIGETSKATDAGIRLTPQCEVFLRAIYKAIADHGEDAPISLGLQSGTRVVKWKILGEVFSGLAFDGADEDDPKKRQDKLSQAMKRHGERLMQLRVIMRASPFLWLTGRKVRGFSHRADSAGDESGQRQSNAATRKQAASYESFGQTKDDDEALF